MRRNIFNFKSQNIKTITKNKYNLVIEELNKCFENLLDNTAEMSEGEPINDYVEFDWIMRRDKYFTAFYWLMDEINEMK